MEGLFVFLVIALGVWAYFGWFYYRPRVHDLRDENAMLRAELKKAQADGRTFDWLLDETLSVERQTRLVDKIHDKWHTQ